MLDPAPVLYLDLVDPGSYVMKHRAELILESHGYALDLAAFEVRPPGEPPIDAAEPGWVEYWDSIAPMLRDLGLKPGTPTRVPRTRKAHELVAFAREQACEVDALEALFRAFFEGDVDLARVDRLVPLAQQWHLDATLAKATLDVDRFAAEIDARRSEAVARGVRGVPTLWFNDRILEGIHSPEAIDAFVRNA